MLTGESNFYSWITKQQKRDDPIGDLACDIQRDAGFPTSENNLDSLNFHLLHNNASNEALCALNEAYKEFSSPKNTQRRSLSLKVRFLVFKRDEYRCQLCGTTAETGARLEIDHRRPVSKGGSNNLENLWTLCFECNRGKGVYEI